MPRCFQGHGALLEDSPSWHWKESLGSNREPLAWLGVHGARSRQAALSSFLSGEKVESTIPVIGTRSAMPMEDMMRMKASVKTGGMIGRTFSGGKQYCCEGFENYDTPCAGYRVSRQCMAEMLDFEKGFPEKTLESALAFAKSPAPTWCCKRTTCMTMGKIKVTDEPWNGPSPQGQEGKDPVSTADIIENSKSCSFEVNPAMHGCRPKRVDSEAKGDGHIGKNWHKCPTDNASGGDQEETNEEKEEAATAKADHPHEYGEATRSDGPPKRQAKDSEGPPPGNGEQPTTAGSGQ